MRVLVTGGAGFIGSHVADALLAAGHEVSIVDDLSSGRRENVPEGARFFEGDIRDPQLVSRVFAEARPEVVSHQAAQTSVSVSTREPVRDAEINVIGSIHLLNEAVRAGPQRFVFASTGGAIYGEVPGDERAPVDRMPRPLSPYACSKYAVECYLEAYRSEHGLQHAVLRYANVYGPRQDPHGEAGVIAIFAQRLLAAKPIQVNARREPGDAGCVRDYVYVQDVVRANLLAVEDKLPAPVVNVCTGVPTATRELAEAMAAQLGQDATINDAPRRAGDVERSVLDGGAFLQAHPATDLETGLRETLDWFRARA